MTDVTQDRDQDGAELSAADEQLLRELTDRARTGGLKLTGEGGLLGKLTKMVVEGALEGEMDDHLGYSKHDPAGRNGGNSRLGYTVNRSRLVLWNIRAPGRTTRARRESSWPGSAPMRTAWTTWSGCAGLAGLHARRAGSCLRLAAGRWPA